MATRSTLPQSNSTFVPDSRGDSSLIRIPPFHYIHVLDRNANVTRLEIGPQTFIRQDHEKFVTGDKPLKMITLPPRHYCEISDPIAKDAEGKPVYDKYGQIKVVHGEFEVRFSEQYNEPFPLYPGESLKLKPTPLLVVKENTALRIEATRNFTLDKKKIVAGDEWLFYGPATYYPRVEERVVTVINSRAIGEYQALKLRARQDFVDKNGNKRKTGEEWLVRVPGSYLPGIDEIVVELLSSNIITTQEAIHLRASQKFTDVYGKERKAGEEWLITSEMASYHIEDIYEEFVGVIPITVLRKGQYCYVIDPVDPKTGKNKLGSKELRKGESSFFLQPGEALDKGIRDAAILQEDQALLLTANQKFSDEDGVEHQPGDRWMVYGPRIYIPPVEVEVVESRSRMPLDKNEGVYVRDTKTGLVRCEFGKSYMLKAHEEYWLKDLSEVEEEILTKQIDVPKYIRDKRKVITYKCPFNQAVQVYDYKKKQSRVVLGPELVLLAPDEQFTVSVLSGGKPKKPGVIKTISVQLGPDFTTDILVVETSDHTRLKLQLSYNWYFKINPEDPKSFSKIFEVKDFIANLCLQMASRVRAAVATVTFDDFHKNSARLIRKSIFGVDDKGKIKNEFFFPENNLVVTNVDVQTVEPVDQRTFENLQKAVTQAIEISTQSLEAQYQYQADMLQQQAQGQLQKIKIDYEAKAEEARRNLMTLEAECQTIQNTGLAKAEAKAKAEAAEIKSKTKVRIAQMKAEARKIEMESELEKKKDLQRIEIEHEKSMSELEINKAKMLSEIESEKFQQIVDAIGQDTLVAISSAGPEFQAELLKGLGLSGYIMTDGNNPINLFNTASGLIGAGGKDELL